MVDGRARVLVVMCGGCVGVAEREYSYSSRLYVQYSFLERWGTLVCTRGVERMMMERAKGQGEVYKHSTTSDIRMGRTYVRRYWYQLTFLFVPRAPRATVPTRTDVRQKRRRSKVGLASRRGWMTKRMTCFRVVTVHVLYVCVYV